MSERLTSVGLDLGTTSTQMVVSELQVENRASPFAVPEMVIGDRQVIYRSKVHFTPLLDENRMDAAALRRIVEEEYRLAGLRREDVDTGAILVTGETSRKENAAAVLAALSDLAGDFVVAAAGPSLESVLAARGAGADVFSRETGKDVLHMDIGGGTANLAYIRDGEIRQTGCLNVGGRLIKLSENGEITYVSPVLNGLCDLKVGEIFREAEAQALSEILTEALEMAAGLRAPGELLEKLWTKECSFSWETPPLETVISFSGGVADCIESEHFWREFGDIGPVLGKTIRKSRLCQGEYRLGRETIRATVIGAGCYSTQLSGSTVFCQNLALPLKNVPVGEEGILALPGVSSPKYRDIIALAEKILAKPREGPLLICLEQDMAKALGQALSARLPREAAILCIDRIKAGAGDYLDIGAPVEGALPVVVKTLIINNE